jgi:hypothetical protein
MTIDSRLTYLPILGHQIKMNPVHTERFFGLLVLVFFAQTRPVRQYFLRSRVFCQCAETMGASRAEDMSMLAMKPLYDITSRLIHG